MRKTVTERFHSKYTINSSGCWLWGDSLTNVGRGRMKVGGKDVSASRLSYELHKGPIAEGMVICHTCDVGHCVNPDHLFLGTQADNNKDRAVKGRSFRPKGELHPRRKLGEEQMQEIRESSDLQSVLAAKYGISQQQVSKIRLGQRWAK